MAGVGVLVGVKEGSGVGVGVAVTVRDGSGVGVVVTVTEGSGVGVGVSVGVTVCARERGGYKALNSNRNTIRKPAIYLFMFLMVNIFLL